MPLNHLNMDEMVFSPAQIATVSVEPTVNCQLKPWTQLIPHLVILPQCSVRPSSLSICSRLSNPQRLNSTSLAILPLFFASCNPLHRGLPRLPIDAVRFFRCRDAALGGRTIARRRCQVCC